MKLLSVSFTHFISLFTLSVIYSTNHYGVNVRISVVITFIWRYSCPGGLTGHCHITKTHMKFSSWRVVGRNRVWARPRPQWISYSSSTATGPFVALAFVLTAFLLCFPQLLCFTPFSHTFLVILDPLFFFICLHGTYHFLKIKYFVCCLSAPLACILCKEIIYLSCFYSEVSPDKHRIQKLTDQV